MDGVAFMISPEDWNSIAEAATEFSKKITFSTVKITITFGDETIGPMVDFLVIGRIGREMHYWNHTEAVFHIRQMRLVPKELGRILGDTARFEFERMGLDAKQKSQSKG